MVTGLDVGLAVGFAVGFGVALGVAVGGGGEGMHDVGSVAHPARATAGAQNRAATSANSKKPLAQRMVT